MDTATEKLAGAVIFAQNSFEAILAQHGNLIVPVKGTQGMYKIKELSEKMKQAYIEFQIALEKSKKAKTKA